MSLPTYAGPTIAPEAPIAEPEYITPDGQIALGTDEYVTLFSRAEFAAYIARLKLALEELDRASPPAITGSAGAENTRTARSVRAP